MSDSSTVIRELRIDRMATGGKGIGNLEDGRVVFVEGGLPGDVVNATITTSKKRHAEAVVTEVLVPSPHRRVPSCQHASTCGGCDWQHVEPASASELRRDIVVDSLRRIGRIDPDSYRLHAGPELAPVGYRTSVRAAISDGSAGFRARGSHDVVVVKECETTHPSAASILLGANFGDTKEITIKVGARTGEQMIIHDAVTKGLPPIHEEVMGHRFQISPDSFFQIRPDGAEALVAAVGDALNADGGPGPDEPIVDAYAGVGLFGALLANGRPLTSIEANMSSSNDARVNLPEDAIIIESPVEDWTPTPAAAVIADPSRAGLGKDGVKTLAATGARRFVLVSCDPASLGRDAGLLRDAGYELTDVTVFDLFGNTSHIEVVSSFSSDSW